MPTAPLDTPLPMLDAGTMRDTGASLANMASAGFVVCRVALTHGQPGLFADVPTGTLAAEWIGGRFAVLDRATSRRRRPNRIGSPRLRWRVAGASSAGRQQGHRFSLAPLHAAWPEPDRCVRDQLAPVCVVDCAALPGAGREATGAPADFGQVPRRVFQLGGWSGVGSQLWRWVEGESCASCPVFLRWSHWHLPTIGGEWLCRGSGQSYAFRGGKA